MRGRNGWAGLLGSLSWLGFLSSLGLLGWLSLGVFVSQAQAFVVINEILADPAPGFLGDANQDGVRSASADEFIEILNYGSQTVDLAGWSLADASAARHIFPPQTLLFPYQYLAVFGGGTPQIDGILWQTASTGTLSLNNGNDTVSLFNAGAVIVDQVIYGSIADHDQSIVRFPEGTAEGFVVHGSLADAGGRWYSPGTSVDGKPLGVSSAEPLAEAAVPDLPTFVYGLAGGVGVLLRRRLNKCTL